MNHVKVEIVICEEVNELFTSAHMTESSRPFRGFYFLILLHLYINHKLVTKLLEHPINENEILQVF